MPKDSGDGECALCGIGGLGKDAYCRGCSSFVCRTCRVAEFTGMHDVGEHLDLGEEDELDEEEDEDERAGEGDGEESLDE